MRRPITPSRVSHIQRVEILKNFVSVPGWPSSGGVYLLRGCPGWRLDLLRHVFRWFFLPNQPDDIVNNAAVMTSVVCRLPKETEATHRDREGVETYYRSRYSPPYDALIQDGEQLDVYLYLGRMKWVIMYTSGYPALWTYYWKQNVIHIQNYMQSVVDPILCHTMRWGSMPKVHAVVKAAYKAWHEADLKYAGSSLEEITLLM